MCSRVQRQAGYARVISGYVSAILACVQLQAGAVIEYKRLQHVGPVFEHISVEPSSMWLVLYVLERT